MKAIIASIIALIAGSSYLYSTQSPILQQAAVIDPFELNGEYIVGDQCQNCPRIFYSQFSQTCPASNQEASISSYGLSLDWYTYVLKLPNQQKYKQPFQIYVRDYNYQKNEKGQRYASVKTDNGYELNIIPCYDGYKTSNACTLQGKDQLLVWESQDGKKIEGCEYTLTKK